MKKLLLTVVVLVLLYPAVPWLLGRAIESRITEITNEIPEQAPYLTVVESHYQRGWYTSTQDVTLEALGGMTPGQAAAAALANPSGKPLRLTIHNVIHHGLVCGATCIGLARVDSTPVFGDDVKAQVEKIFGSADAVTVTTRLHLLGGFTTQVSSPAIKDAAVGSDGKLSSDGFVFTLEESGHGDHFKSHGTAPHLLYSGPENAKIEISGIGFDGSSKRALRTLYTGDANFVIKNLSTSGAPSKALNLSDFAVTSATKASDGYLDAAVTMGTGAVVTAPLTLKSAHFDVTFQHLEMETLEKLTSSLRELRADKTVDPNERTQKTLGILQTQGAALLTHQPALGIDRISLANASGELLITGGLRLHDFTAADIAPGADPKLLVQKVDIDLDFSCDEAFLKTLPGAGAGLGSQLQAFVQQGLATLDNGKYHTKVVFHQGQATFNGKPFQAGLGAAAPPGTAPTTAKP